MYLHHLKIQNLRNIESLELSCSPRINLINGENGSGKTSLLEAIHLLALGRSFRSHLKSRLIRHGVESLSVFTELYSHDAQGHWPLGIQKFASGKSHTRLNGEEVSSLSEIISLLPTQLLNPDSFELINTGSKLKRQFIDWGLFHVKKNFYVLWTRVERILKQRNEALKQRWSQNEIQVWDEELTTLSLELNELRQEYMAQFMPVIQELSAGLQDFPQVNMTYYAGWKEEQGLEEQLRQAIYRDLQRGYTSVGPHRATIHIESQGQSAHEVLSRGQQKMLIFTMRFAQAELLYRQMGKLCLYLIDDFTSELDARRTREVIAMMRERQGQFFITSLEPQDPLLFENGQSNCKMFHMEHGVAIENASL